MTAVTFLRVTATTPAVPLEQQTRTILLVQNSDLGEAVRGLASTPDIDLDTVPAEALPGIVEDVDFTVADLLLIGTTVGHEWTTWLPRVPAPPVPR